MRLQFDKSGRRFFFLTFCLRGRAPILSRIVREDGPSPAYGTALSEAGEKVAALWRGIHSRWPFLTASNFVIMPDHIHLLLIADYRQAPTFDILDWFHHFRREAEDLVAPFANCRPEQVWEDHFWLLLVNAGAPLAAVRRYIKLNPARKVWKTEHPDMFVRHNRFRHPILNPSLPWTAIGNLTLLSSPFLFDVRLTRKKTVEEHAPEIEAMVEKAKRGMIPVCGFLSPGEKELGRRLREETFTRWIKTVPHGLPERFDPTVEDSRYLAAGRELILSSFAPNVPTFPVNWDNCHLMNDRNAALVSFRCETQ